VNVALTASPLTIDDSKALADLPFGDLVPLVQTLYDGERPTAPVYVRRQSVTHLTTDKHGHVFVHLLSGKCLEVAGTLREIAAGLS
jgi:hypothetical protein